MKKTINDYVKNPRARFLIKCIAAVGYILFGMLWWIMYVIVTVLYRLICEIIESLFVVLEGLSALKSKLRKLHQHFSYFEMLILGIIFITMMLVMVSLLWIITIIVPAGY